MRFDVKTLETFNQLAREGTESAANSLADLLGTQTTIDITAVEIVPLPDLALEFAGTEVHGVEIGFDGGMRGSVILVFDEESAQTLVQEMIPTSMATDEAMYESGVTEAANIMIGGVLGAWGEHFEEKLQPEPPEYIHGDWEIVVPQTMPAWTGHQAILSFASRLRCEEQELDFDIYILPEERSFESMVGAVDGDEASELSVEKLSVFNEMTKIGAKTASRKITEMTDIRTTVDISRITVAQTRDIDAILGSSERLGAVATLEESPNGIVAVLFDTDSAKTVGDAMLPMAIESDSLTDQHHAAIKEIGNMMISGFIDGWANVLGRTIQHSPPEVIKGGAKEKMIESQLVNAHDEEHVFIINSAIKQPGGEVDCHLVALPTKDGFLQIIEDVSVETATEAVHQPEMLQAADYEIIQNEIED
ncbi:chemotaxis protein CheC [Salinarchaeum sp. IM2453]|uniref:chemotaxis protein CheC n=1 Tax=Salinarchaeum sp. IM2453 TaxID=2862870 RepID=UPI001C829294|nr:chemotaxis protein CheC [Salinarchaeum sp. IM2453]QZA89214.1 chemotaxis protein CheC [Salinarchaeum sp. IM2453]